MTNYIISAYKTPKKTRKKLLKVNKHPFSGEKLT